MSEIEGLFKQIKLKGQAIHQQKQAILKQEESVALLKTLASTYSPYQVGDKHPKGFVIVDVVPCFLEDGTPIFFYDKGFPDKEKVYLKIEDLNNNE